MPRFTCKVCGEPFEVPQRSLDKYRGWTPSYCRAHSPKKGAGQSARQPRGRARGAAPAEEDLTLAQVLERYQGGPQDGVFTDGSARPNPGPGGWGFVWVEGGEVRLQDHGQEAHTTNNRMELTALIAAFGALPEDARATVYTDSKLCVNTIESWAAGWERKGWKRKGGEIKNLELVQELYGLRRERPGCKLEWIAAHSGNRWNEYADSLATAWARSTL